MSAAIRVEVVIVIESRYRPSGLDVVERFVRDAQVEIFPVDADLTAAAITCSRRFGKGRHRAALNSGDCFGYALAERTGHPVLCTGNDFAATDIEGIWPASKTDAPRQPE